MTYARSWVLVVTGAALVGACGPRTGGAPATEDAGDTGDIGDIGGASTDRGSTGLPPTTGSTADPGTAGATTGPDPTTTAAESTGPAQATTGGADESGCPAYCAKLDECGDPEAEGCVDWCPYKEKGYGYIGEGCLALYIREQQCVSDMTCAQLNADPQACADEQDALTSEACTVASCRGLCAKLLECGTQGTLDGEHCAVQCSRAQAEAFLDEGEACAREIAKYQVCFVTIPCEQIDPPLGCEDEVAAVEAACG